MHVYKVLQTMSCAFVEEQDLFFFYSAALLHLKAGMDSAECTQGFDEGLACNKVYKSQYKNRAQAF